MMRGGRFCRPHNTSMLSGRMGQTSIERLKDYLVQLPPQSQALLMREFERAIERGEDASVASIVLEQLRNIVRGADEETRPRTEDPARLLFRPLEPFLVEGSAPVRPGQIRRSSLLPVWQWLNRDGAPEPAREFDAALAKVRETGAAHNLEIAVRKFQCAAAEAIFKIVAPGQGGDKQRALCLVALPECFAGAESDSLDAATWRIEYADLSGCIDEAARETRRLRDSGSCGPARDVRPRRKNRAPRVARRRSPPGVRCMAWWH